MELLEQISVVLVEPSHPGNIGAAARAIKTMGLGRLSLVNPRHFPSQEANQRSAGAEDVLQASRVVNDLPTALAKATLTFGTSVREREVNWPMYTPKQAASEIIKHLLASQENHFCVLFGREHSGLTNEELDQCSAQICIPANPEYSSLNLASAVQIISYELRAAALTEMQQDGLPKTQKARQEAANQTQRQGHLDHLEQVLDELKFARNDNSPLLMRKLTRLYNKADLSVEEIQILRGILTAIQSKLVRSKA